MVGWCIWWAWQALPLDEAAPRSGWRQLPPELRVRVAVTLGLLLLVGVLLMWFARAAAAWARGPSPGVLAPPPSRHGLDSDDWARKPLSARPASPSDRPTDRTGGPDPPAPPPRDGGSQ